LDLNAEIYSRTGAELKVLNGGVVHVYRHFFGDMVGDGVFAANADVVMDGKATPVPDLAAGAFFIEAEDFNYDRGQYELSANTMPYVGGAYDGRAGRNRIDYYQLANETQSDLYRDGEGPGINVGIATLDQLSRGTYWADVNYVIGWNDSDEWYNYTRDYPPSLPASYLFARMSSGGRPNGVRIHQVTGPASTTSQTLALIGEATGPASGNWSRYVFVPVRDAAGELVELTWSGLVTFRATILPDSQENLDYFVLAPALTSGPAQLLEVMGEDLGQDLSGFNDNFSLQSLILAAGSHVQLIDLEDNAPGATQEAVYLETLTVPDGAILDLNGMNLYAQDIQVDGTIVGGTVLKVSPEAPSLTVVRSGENIEIRWSLSAAGFALQMAATLEPSDAWEPNTTPPTLEGEDYVVTEPLGGMIRFYRLYHE
jgi:hypothetical protein